MLLLCSLASSTVLAAISQTSDRGKVDLIAEVQSIQPGQSFSVGLLFELEEGWHTYWINPGDSGLPVSVSWELPPGFSAGDIQWPYPSRLGTDTVANFGYENEVLLITDIQTSPAVTQGEIITIKAKVEWLICKEECLPEQSTLSISLPVGNKAPISNPLWKEKFTDSRKKLPITSQDWTVNAAVDKDHILLSISSPSWFRNKMKDIHFFPEQIGLFDYSSPQRLEKTEEGYLLLAKLSVLALEIPSRLRGILVSEKSWSRLSENKALRIDVPLAQIPKEDNKSYKEVFR